MKDLPIGDIFNKVPQIRNRKDKRRIEGILRKQGRSPGEIKEQIDTIKQFNKILKDPRSSPKYRDNLHEGEKVKVNTSRINSSPLADKLNPKYKTFIENNKDTIFTVQYDESRTHKPTVVCLKEDETDPKWLFSADDLLVFDPKDKTFKELYLIEEDNHEQD